MGSRVEILNAGGYRSDGRTQYELRAMNISLGSRSDQYNQDLLNSSSYPHPSAPDGIAFVAHGLTEACAKVFGPREPQMRRDAIHDRAFINVQVMMLPFSGGMGGRRRGRGDKRLLELAAAIRSTFEPVVQTGLYPRSQIDIILEIHQQDGGVLPACINATTLALTYAGIAMYDQVVAVSAGLHSTSVLLDLNHYEENDIPNLVVGVMPRSGKVTLVNMESRLHLTRFEGVFSVACQAAKFIQTEMENAILNNTSGLVSAMVQADPSAGARMDEEMDE